MSSGWRSTTNEKLERSNFVLSPILEFNVQKTIESINDIDVGDLRYLHKSSLSVGNVLSVVAANVFPVTGDFSPAIECAFFAIESSVENGVVLQKI